MSITTITLAGANVDLDDVDFSVTVSHGRGDVASTPEPASAQITMLLTGAAFIEGDIGDPLVIEAWATPRFTGTVTDMAVDHIKSLEGNGYTAVTILATGPLTRLGRVMVGSGGYVQETLDARVTGILDATGLSYIARTDPDMLLLAQDPAVTSALEALASVCAQTGATMADTPSGAILFESYTRRGYDYNAATWAYVVGAWSANAEAWDSTERAISAAPTPVTVPASGVVWEPRWVNSQSTVINDVTVLYGPDPQASVNAVDTASRARHGTRAVQLPTTLVEASEATLRANAILTAQSVARWDLQRVEVLLDDLDTPTRTAALALVSGGRVLVSDLPQPAPALAYLGIVEGWTETHTPAGPRLVLSLSDPRYSYAVCEWVAVPSALTWAAVNPTIAWYDVIVPADLT